MRKGSHGRKMLAVVALAGEIREAGDKLTYRAIAERLGDASKDGVDKVGQSVRLAQSKGLFPWFITRGKGGSKPGDHHPKGAGKEDEVGIEARKLAIRLAWRADMGDGRAEIDEPPHGVPPRSGIDHAVEGRKRYDTSVFGHCVKEARRHRADLPHSRIGKDWH